MYWTRAVAPDGTTYIGFIHDSNAREIHRWLNIDSSLPDYVDINDIAVLATPPGVGNIESFWSRGNNNGGDNKRDEGVA